MNRKRLLGLLALLFACAAPRPPAIHARTAGAVASPETWATAEGEKILREGGNAVDAAVCMGFVLAVTHPEAGNLGGGGFLVVHTKSEQVVVDAREVAPRAARPDMYLDSSGKKARREASLVGPLASGVPGSVAGYLWLLERHGRLTRAQVLAPAIHLAENGFAVDQGLHDSIHRNRDLLAKYPETAEIFLRGGEAPKVGSKLRQPALAKVLKRIAESGVDGFYKDWFPEQVQKASERYGGVLTSGDFYTYQVKVREPLRGTYRGYDILTMPPPSSGGICLLQMLEMLERGHYEGMRTEQRMHLVAEAGRRAFADRARYLADPDYTAVPVERLLDKHYIESRFNTIRMDHATPSSSIHAGLEASAPPESSETCHFSVVDDEGNAVSCTTTLNGAFGCGLAVQGVLLNNEMDDFTTAPGRPNQFGLIQSSKNEIAPGKRPLSSMTPTILLKNGEPQLVLGSPGGPTIISTVCQVIANHVAAGMPLEQAVAEPRVHCQWMPDELVYERLTPAQRRALEALGHRLRQKERPMGDVQAVGRATYGGHLTGVSDPRGRGRATR